VEVLKISGTAFVGGTLLCDHRTPIVLASTGYLKVQVTGTVVLEAAPVGEQLFAQAILKAITKLYHCPLSHTLLAYWRKLLFKNPESRKYEGTTRSVAETLLGS
jgi:hypothetical protein